MTCSSLQQAIIILALLTFISILVTIVVRSIRRPDHDDYFDEPEHWGDR